MLLFFVSIMACKCVFSGCFHFSTHPLSFRPSRHLLAPEPQCYLIPPRFFLQLYNQFSFLAAAVFLFNVDDQFQPMWFFLRCRKAGCFRVTPISTQGALTMFFFQLQEVCAWRVVCCEYVHIYRYSSIRVYVLFSLSGVK